MKSISPEQEEKIMSAGKYRCKECGAPLELFLTSYYRFPIDGDSGEIGEVYEENVPGSNEYVEVQCSEGADDDCGFIYRGGEIIERSSNKGGE
ncbi:MAG: hypothetical protein KAX39_06165 [candidate division Zixibacteria bacterium]|nr:hypothetical protein [candidate division Zixibacteria bacterium]